MVRPLRNNEIVWLAKLLVNFLFPFLFLYFTLNSLFLYLIISNQVFVSRLFNEYYDLPSDKSTTILTWNEVKND